MPPARLPGVILAVSGAAAILGLTLIPNPSQAAFAALTPFSCLVCGEHGGADVLLNLVLFAPMAVGLRLFGWSWGRVVVACAALSMTVELLQYSVLPGRDASLSDLLTNTAGGALAAWVGGRLGRILLPDGVLARRLSLGALAFWLGVTGFSAVALRPWSPGGWLRSECTRSQSTPHRFVGTVSQVRIDGATVPCDAELIPARPLRAALSRGDVRIDAAMRSGEATDGQRLIHAVRARSGFPLMLAQDGRAAAFTAPAMAGLFRLYSPVLRLRGAFPRQTGVPVEIAAGLHAGRMWVEASRPGFRERAEVALSPSFGWSLLLPWGLQEGRPVRVPTGLWIVGLILPAAYWVGFIGRPLLGLTGVAAALVTGLGLLPVLAGFPPVHWSEWLAGAAGIGLGWALHRLAAYLQSRCGSPSTSAYSSP